MNRFSAARLLISAASPVQFPSDHGVEIAFAGRSNAGKSSALNAVLGRRALARSGKTPGQTRLINFFEIGADARVIDLPGYGYARVAEAERRRWAQSIERLRERAAFAGLFVIVDSRRGLSEADEALIDWAEPQLRSVHVLLSKADKLTRQQAAACLSAARSALGGRATAQLFSATEGTGVGEARQVLTAWLAAGPRGDHRT